MVVEKFKSACDAVTCGNRNGQLVPLARLGRSMGIVSDDLDALMHKFLDRDDPLDEREVSRAISKAEEQVRLGDGTITDIRRLANAVTRKTGDKATDGERATYERMVRAGVAWFDDRPIYGGSLSSAIYDLSPRKFPLSDHREKAALMVERLGDDPDGYLFAGEQHSHRDAEHVRPSAELAAAIRSGAMEIPPQIAANPFTGATDMVTDAKTKRQHPSMATTKLLLHRRYALVEFDGYKDVDGVQHKLTLDSQALFWIGCITTGTLVPVLLVYSGSKSIHGLIRLFEPGEEGAPSDDPVRCWQMQWAELELLLKSAPNALYHLDGSCKDATRQCRLAGHKRADTKRYQELLFLTYPERPGCGIAASMGMCGVCAEFGTCPHTHPRSQWGTTVLRN